MEYLIQFNCVCDVFEDAGLVLDYDTSEAIREQVKKAYDQGLKVGKGIVKQEELDVDKAVKLQRLMRVHGVVKK